MRILRVAATQTPVTTDVAKNAATIRDMMRRVKAKGGDLAHFTEGALSGYGRKEMTPFEQWAPDGWARLRQESEAIASLARELELWVVFGSVHPLDTGQRPHNCLYVVNDRGAVVTRYDKRFCSHNEVNGWYTPGFEPCVFEAHGVKFGCAICLDASFPEIFDEYRRLGVHCVLISAFDTGGATRVPASDDHWPTLARAHAIGHTYWVSLVTPSNKVQGGPTQFIDPCGGVVAKGRRHRRDVVLGEIDLGPGGLWHSIEWGRNWRSKAREGCTYRTHASTSPRTADKASF
jgi:predicted amidohydrolase